MKLRYSPSSPFVRKVTATAILTGLDSRIERVPTNTTDPMSGLSADNPLGKVPALLTDDGEKLFDSPVICEYLDNLGTGAKLFPPSGKERWTALRQQAIADGIMDAAVLCLYESRRPKAGQSAEWTEKQRGKILDSCKVLEAEVEALKGPPTIGRIAVGCALEYLDFRMADLGWRTAAPKLARWVAEFGAHNFMAETKPKAPA